VRGRAAAFRKLLGRTVCPVSGALLISCFTAAVEAADDNPIGEAQKVFKQYMELERAYDPAQGELFTPTATIKDTRIYQDGTSKVLTWTGEHYKLIIKAQLPVSKARNEQFVYSQVSYAREGNNVRIKCNRYSPQKKTGGPLELLVAPVSRGCWKIVEETCQIQP
jgi:hypothetical protein